MIETLLNLGIVHELSESRARRVFLTNKFAFILALLEFPYIIIFRLLDLPLFSFVILPLVLTNMVCIFLNYKQRYAMSRALFIITAHVAAFMYSLFLGFETGIPNLFFPFIGISILIVEPDNKIGQWFGVLLSFVCFFLLLFNHAYFFYVPTLLNPLYLFVIQCSAALTVFMLTYFFLRFYFQANIMSEKKLKKAYDIAQIRQKEMETLSRQATLSRLTMGVAHEIRNPLAGMLGRCELVLKKPEDPTAVIKFANILKSCIGKLVKITDAMLKYGVDSTPERMLLNVNHVLEEVVYIAEGKCLKENIVITKSFDTVSDINANHILLYQVFLNLILNAIQSLKHDPKQIEVSSKQYEQGAPYFEQPCLEIVIKDNGGGIPNAIQEKIFDPFFSTKYDQPGLGLSIVLKNIKELNGKLKVTSSSAKGSVFMIYLPLA